MLGKLVEEAAADVRVGHLAAAEEDRELDLVAADEELGGVAAFGFEVVFVDLGTDADFFQLDDVLVLAGLTLFPALIVAELAED